MNKPVTHEAGAAGGEPGLVKSLLPVQEGLDRAHKASQTLTSAYRDIAVHQAQFLQRGVFDVLSEIQTLQRARGPEEFLALGSEFAWAQTGRYLKALGDFYNGMCGCWADALNAAPKAPEQQRRPVH